MELSFYTLIGGLGVLAIVDSINPSAIAITGYILTKSPEKQKINVALAYILGIFCSYFLIGCGLLLGLDALLKIQEDMQDNRILLGLQTVLGGGMVVWSLFPARPRSPNRLRPKIFSPATMFLLGVVVTFAELLTAFPYFAAIGLLEASHNAMWEKLGLLGAYNILFIVPPLAMLILYKLHKPRINAWLGKRLQSKPQQTNEGLRWIVGILGFLLAGSALANLL
jgi:cytochrome c biogenesis protein CcdA